MDSELSDVSKAKNKKPHVSVWFGGAYRIRTGDLYNANVARYQLC